MDRSRHNLSFSFNAKILPTYIITDPEKHAARVDSWYQTRLSEIGREEQAFRQRLNTARESGAIDQNRYMEAIMGLNSPTCPFKEARQEAQEAYFKERKIL